jgi:hypothetical protein
MIAVCCQDAQFEMALTSPDSEETGVLRHDWPVTLLPGRGYYLW